MFNTFQTGFELIKPHSEDVAMLFYSRPTCPDVTPKVKEARAAVYSIVAETMR